MLKTLIERSTHIEDIWVSCCDTNWRSFLEIFSSLSKCEELKKVRFVNGSPDGLVASIVLVNEYLKSGVKLEMITLGTLDVYEIRADEVLEMYGV